MASVDMDEIADELYGLAPEDFTAARDAAANAATDGVVRKQIKALRKPTSAAAAVNQLVRTIPADIDSLLDLGDALRAAMTGDPGELRRLTEERRRLIAAMTSGVGTNVRDDVTATLEAATADPDLGAAVRSGRLVKPLRYAGFGALPDLTDAVATPPKSDRPRKPATPPRKAASKSSPAKSTITRVASEPKPDIAAARERVLELSGIADDAQRRYEIAVQATHDARTALDQAEKARAEAHRVAKAAHAEAEKARRDLGKLERS